MSTRDGYGQKIGGGGKTPKFSQNFSSGRLQRPKNGLLVLRTEKIGGANTVTECHMRGAKFLLNLRDVIYGQRLTLSRVIELPIVGESDLG